MITLRHKVAVVTGAAGGIGAAIAIEAARQGMSVAICDVDQAGLQRTALSVRAQGSDCLTYSCDVSDWGAVADMAETVVADAGAPYLLVNNAGIAVPGRSWELDRADWDRVLGVNLVGTVAGIHSFVPAMMNHGEGHIVNIASMSGLVVSASSGSPYVASKHAVVGLSETLHREFAEVGSPLRVSVVCPGPVRTDMDGDVGYADTIEPDAVAAAVFATVLKPRFWVLTHRDTFAAACQLRIAQAIDGVDPDEASEDPVILRWRRAQDVPE